MITSASWRPAAKPGRWQTGMRRERSLAQGWARALRDRYRTRHGRGAHAERVFARPLTTVRERWLLATHSFLPQIHLAIQPLLRQAVWHTSTVLANGGDTASGHASRPDPVSRITTARAPRLRSIEGLAAASSPAAGPSPTARRRQQTAAPLQLVFQRLRAPEEALGAPMPPWTGTGMAARPVLARTLAARSRRVDQRLADRAERVLARRAAPTTSEQAIEPVPAWPAREARFRQGLARPQVPAAAEPALNINVLADRVMQQIDSRLHAWQERTAR
ncbi:MAG TPA: hypothetical protein VIL35_10335 [Vicinamibacterales bacterium]